MDWTEVLAELISFIKTASPEIWAIVRRQVIVEGLQLTFWAIIFAIGAVAGGKLTKVLQVRIEKRFGDDDKRHYSSNYGDAAIGVVAVAVVAITCGIVSLGLLSGAAGRFINPDYYAIKLLLGYVH